MGYTMMIFSGMKYIIVKMETTEASIRVSTISHMRLVRV